MRKIGATRTAMKYLADEVGGRVIKRPIITYQQAYMAALTVGKSGPEVDKEGEARPEIEALWVEVNRLLAETQR